jgi:hypothetical protein
MLQPKSFFPQGPNSHGNASFMFFFTVIVLPLLLVYLLFRLIFPRKHKFKDLNPYPKGFHSMSQEERQQWRDKRLENIINKNK